MAEKKSRRGKQLNVAITPELKRWLVAHVERTGKLMHRVVGEALAAYRASKERSTS